MSSLNWSSRDLNDPKHWVMFSLGKGAWRERRRQDTKGPDRWGMWTQIQTSPSSLEQMKRSQKVRKINTLIDWRHWLVYFLSFSCSCAEFLRNIAAAACCQVFEESATCGDFCCCQPWKTEISVWDHCNTAKWDAARVTASEHKLTKQT